MATAVSTKASQGLPKMKRPPPPSIQTPMNGVNNSTSSPSPSLSSKNPPSASRIPPDSAQSINGTTSDGGLRSSNRQRKDALKIRDGKGFKIPGAGPRRLSSELSEQERRRLANLPPRPYVQKTSQFLKKFRGCDPSLIVHLHPTHFRFDQQDGTFGYNSPMRPFIEHLKTQTIPHDLLEELIASNVTFYDGCLIVQIHDHRTAAPTSSSSNAVGAEKSTPFSIHNHNEHITPSPFVPYPASLKKPQLKQENSSSNVNGEKQASPQRDELGEKDSEGTKAKSDTSKRAKIYTTVLHPTALSLLAEMTILASTPDVTTPTRRQQTAAGNSVPPQTPLSANPSTPRNQSGPPQKRQKMMLDESNYHDFEAEVLRATSGTLYLEPAKDVTDVSRIVEALRDPRHEGSPPQPTTRKRTVAELAADEALAAEEERFMLIADERLASVAGAAGGTKGANVDTRTGSVAFEPRFTHFKTIESLRLEIKKRKEQAAKEAAEREAEKRAQEERLHQEKREEAEERARQQQEAMRRESMRVAAARQQSVQAQAQLHSAQNMHGHPPPNAMTHTPQQHHLQHVTQPQHSSPLAQNSPPSIASPLVGNAMAAHPAGGVPMNLTSSNQGPGSPPRPPSAQHHMTPAMAQQMGLQRSQQGPSRHGTPQGGRPATSTPRMSQASPVPGAAARTPMMNQAGLAANPHLQDNRFSPQQRQMMMIQHAQQQHQQQQNAHQTPMHQSPQPGMQQMSPEHINAVRAAQLRQQQAQRQQQQQQAAAAQRQQQQQQQQANSQQSPLQQGQNGQAFDSQQFSNYSAQLSRQMQNMAANTRQQQQQQQQQVQQGQQGQLGQPQQPQQGTPNMQHNRMGVNMQHNPSQNPGQNSNVPTQQAQVQRQMHMQLQQRQIYERLNPEQQQIFRSQIQANSGHLPQNQMQIFKSMAIANSGGAASAAAAAAGMGAGGAGGAGGVGGVTAAPGTPAANPQSMTPHQQHQHQMAIQRLRRAQFLQMHQQGGRGGGGQATGQGGANPMGQGMPGGVPGQGMQGMGRGMG